MEYSVFIEESAAVLRIFPALKPVLQAGGGDGNRLDA